MKIISISIIAGLLFALAACTPAAPTLDASNKETISTSSKAIFESLPEERKKPFKDSLTGFVMIGSLAAMAKNIPQDEAMKAIMAKLDGKNGEEIIALAQVLKTEMRK